jgi:hypothetical protein
MGERLAVYKSFARRAIWTFSPFDQMAGGDVLETNRDIAPYSRLVDDPTTKIIFMNAALADFAGAHWSCAQRKTRTLEAEATTLNFRG